MVDVFGNHGLCGLLKESTHEKSPKCLGRNLGDLGEFCKGLKLLDILLFMTTIRRLTKKARVGRGLRVKADFIPLLQG